MRLPRIILLHLVRLSSTLCLLLISALLLLAANSSTPLRISHAYHAPNPEWADGEFRIDVAGGGIWLLHLQTRTQTAPAQVRLPDPLQWTITHPEPDWLDRISNSQTGPMFLGFCTHLRHVERSQPVIAHTQNRRQPGYFTNPPSPNSPPFVPEVDITPDSTIDPKTGRLREEAVVEEERITRIPLAGLVVILLIPSLLRIALLVRHRRKPEADQPSIPTIARRYVFSISAALSTILLAIAIWQWMRTQSIGTSLSAGSHRHIPYLTLLNNPTAQPFSNSFMLTHEGWQLVRDIDIVEWDKTSNPYVYQYLSIDTQNTALANQTPIAGPRFLGFVVSREDLSTPTGPNVGNLPSPAIRSTHLSLLAPHWAIVFFSAILPALWLYTRLKPNQRAHRLHNNLCLNCGYDLRASPQRCPECGAQAPIEKKPKATEVFTPPDSDQKK